MLYFSSHLPSTQASYQDTQLVVINPYAQNLNDFDCDLMNAIQKMKKQKDSSDSLKQNQVDYIQQFQIVLEIEKIKYRIDSQKRLLKLLDIFKKNNFSFILRIALNGEQVVQEEEINILKQILQQQTGFSQVELWVNQIDNQYDWNLIDLLQFKQIGTLILRLDKYCEQSLRSLQKFTNKIRVLHKAKFVLKEDIPMKLFEMFAWPAKIQLEIEESQRQGSTLRLQFLSLLKYINQLEINYIDNTSYSTQSLVLPILTKQIQSISKVDRISFSYQEQFSSSLHPAILQKELDSRNYVDFSIFLPYERYLTQQTKFQKFNAEKEFYYALSTRNLLDISLTITVNQIIQLFEIFKKQQSYVKLMIKVIPNQFNLYPQTFSKEKDDELNMISALNIQQVEGVSINNLTLTCSQSISFDNRRTFYNRFAIICIYILSAKITKLNLNIQSILEGDLEKLTKKINMNSQIKHLQIAFEQKVAFNTSTVMYLSSSNIQTMSCYINKNSYQFFYQLFLNLRSLQALHLKIDQVPQINDKFFSLNIPYTYLQLNQQLSPKQKMAIFMNKNIFLYFNSSDGQKRTIFSQIYYNNISILLSLNAINKKCLFSAEKSIFKTSLLELLEL